MQIVIEKVKNPGSIIVVGGSLAGLALAIALKRIGFSVTVVEQMWGEERGGSGLGVERALLSEVTGVDATKSEVVPELPVVHTYRDTSTWHAIYRWLRSVARVVGGIDIIEGTHVEDVHQSESSARAVGAHFDLKADLVVGADGYRSTVRRAVDPDRPYAPYGGFIIWRGLVSESRIAAKFTNGIRGGLHSSASTTRLVAYFVPGEDGDARPGRRRINFAWYDASHTDWLRERGFLKGDEVMSSVMPDALDQPLIDELSSLADAWGPKTGEVLTAAIEDRAIFGTPLAQYLPRHLSNERVAMVGDAAHVASPMVGAGLVNGLLDCIALARALESAGGSGGVAGVKALKAFDVERLGPNRRHVNESISETKALLASVAVT